MIERVFLLDDIGFFGPLILFTLTIIVLWGRVKYLSAYIIFAFLNSILNKTLKGIIQEPRPGKPTDKTVYKGYETIDGIEIYGMPSGHAQSVIFSTTYMYLVSKSINILIGSSLVSMLSLIQRYRFSRHSIKQLLVGSGVGTLMAFISFKLTEYYLTC